MQRLIIPFLIFAIAALVLHNTLLHLKIISGNKYGVQQYMDGIKHLLFLSSYEEIIGAMWFLPALFIISIFSMFAIHSINNHKSTVYLWVGVVLLSTLFCYLNIPSPYCIWEYISISWIFILGYYCSKTQLDQSVTKWPYVVLSIVILASFLLLQVRLGLQASMIGKQSILFPIVFIAGIVMINGIAHSITNTKLGTIFGLIGDFSFSIMALHFIAFKTVNWGRTLFDSSIEISAFPVDKANIEVWMPIYLIFGIVIPITIAILYNKFKDAWNNHCRIQESKTDS